MKKSSSKAIDRAFDAKTLAAARELAEGFQVIVSREEGHWFGRGLEMPHVFGDGSTPTKCLEATREALTAAVAYLIEKGETPPGSGLISN